MNQKTVKTPAAAIFYLLSGIWMLFLLTPLATTLLKIRFVPNLDAILFLVGTIGTGVLLLMKRKDLLTAGALGVLAIHSLLAMFRFFTIFTLLVFLAYALLAAAVFVLGTQKIVKVESDSLKCLMKILAVIPGVLLLFIFVFSFSTLLVGQPFTMFLANGIKNLTMALGALLLGIWLGKTEEEVVSTEEENFVSAPAEPVKGHVDMLVHILLLLFTGGIWMLIWVYRTTKYLNTAPKAEQHNPTGKLLLFMFIPFYSIYWFYKQGQRIDNYGKAKGLNLSEVATMSLIFGIFFPLVSCIMMQDRINNIAKAAEPVAVPVATAPAAPAPVAGSADELKKYKELLDMGAITPEEYELKKKELLGF